MTMPRSTPFTARIGRGVALFLLSAIVLAAPQPAQGRKLPFLLELPGVKVHAHYVPGSLDRAAHAQLRFELLLNDFQQWTRKSDPIHLWILDREAWEAMDLERPYGMPVRVDDVVVLAAAGDDGTVALWRGLVGDDLPTSATGSGIAIQSTAAEVGSLAMNDLMAELEVARLLAERSDFRGESRWIDELIAHVVANAAFLRHESARTEEIGGVFDHLLSLRDGPLELVGDVPPPALPLEAWLAYQGRYFVAARLILGKDNLTAVRKLFKMTKKGARPLTWTALLERYPELAVWFEDSFRVTG